MKYCPFCREVQPSGMLPNIWHNSKKNIDYSNDDILVIYKNGKYQRLTHYAAFEENRKYIKKYAYISDIIKFTGGTE